MFTFLLNRKSALLTFALFSVSVTFASGTPVDSAQAEFDQMKTEYFKTLHFDDPVLAKKIPELEKRLLSRAEVLLAKPIHSLTPLESKWLVYTAMFMGNTRVGIEEKKSPSVRFRLI